MIQQIEARTYTSKNLIKISAKKSCWTHILLIQFSLKQGNSQKNQWFFIYTQKCVDWLQIHVPRQKINCWCWRNTRCSLFKFTCISFYSFLLYSALWQIGLKMSLIPELLKFCIGFNHTISPFASEEAAIIQGCSSQKINQWKTELNNPYNKCQFKILKLNAFCLTDLHLLGVAVI